jgi:ribonuclease-3
MLKKVFGLRPNNVELYKLALLHRSASQHLPDGTVINNERLEFLGDAIIESVVSDYLYIEFPYESEGFLTQMRSRLVNRVTLNQLCADIGMAEYICSNSGGGRGGDGAVKNINGDAFEAIIGAMYLDKGYDFTNRLLIKLLARQRSLDEVTTTETDFKSRLIEWCQKNRHHVRFVTSLGQWGEQKGMTFRSVAMIDNLEAGYGLGNSKKEAEQQAAYAVSMTMSEERGDAILDLVDTVASQVVTEHERPSSQGDSPKRRRHRGGRRRRSGGSGDKVPEQGAEQGGKQGVEQGGKQGARQEAGQGDKRGAEQGAVQGGKRETERRPEQVGEQAKRTEERIGAELEAVMGEIVGIVGVTETAPATEEKPVAQKKPTSEKKPATEKKQTTDKKPATEKKPAAKKPAQRARKPKAAAQEPKTTETEPKPAEGAQTVKVARKPRVAKDAQSAESQPAAEVSQQPKPTAKKPKPAVKKEAPAKKEGAKKEGAPKKESAPKKEGEAKKEGGAKKESAPKKDKPAVKKTAAPKSAKPEAKGEESAAADAPRKGKGRARKASEAQETAAQTPQEPPQE